MAAHRAELAEHGERREVGHDAAADDEDAKGGLADAEDGRVPVAHEVGEQHELEGDQDGEQRDHGHGGGHIPCHVVALERDGAEQRLGTWQVTRCGRAPAPHRAAHPAAYIAVGDGHEHVSLCARGRAGDVDRGHCRGRGKRAIGGGEGQRAEAARGGVDRQCAGAQRRVGKDGGAGSVSNVDGARQARDGVGKAGICVVGVGGREQQQRQPRVDGDWRVVDRGDADGNGTRLAVAHHRAGTVGGHEGEGVSPVGVGVGHVDHRIEARAQRCGLDLAHLA
eukprot:scaffold95194_cov65-Phaeocystis_antarctica.AAC.1